MDPMTIIALLIANKEELLGAAGTIVLVASTVAQHTTNEKDDRFWSRVGSVIDILSGAVGKAAPRNVSHLEVIKNKPGKDAMRLLKHVFTGKFDESK